MKYQSQQRVCRGCYQHRALFRFRGVVRADCDHELCFRCYRSLRDAMRPIRLRSEDVAIRRDEILILEHAS
jgi:hypothetical protein